MHGFIAALGVMLLWVVVLSAFALLGRSGPATLAPDRRLVIYTSGIFISATVLYCLAFNTPFLSTQTPFPAPGLPWLGFPLMVVGGALMVAARARLRSLTLGELFFSRSTKDMTIREGVYRHLRHPMYLGLLFMLLGSLVMYPGVPELVLFLFTLVCIKLKEAVEEAQPRLLAHVENSTGAEPCMPYDGE